MKMEIEFEVIIDEKLSRIVTIKAKSEEEACQKVKELYQNEEIVLDDNDFLNVEFTVNPNE